ncbi:MAG: B12-binding domain-containing radical SAM protein [Candidatus Omnitrophica bacterium]|nr:B12-binding domain-containing radical SAM protein [Candidatus Omnitrophota bacterium]
MKILLVNPSWKTKVSKKGHRFNRTFPPLDLMYCAAILEKAGIDVEIFDANADSKAKADIITLSRKYDKIIITSSPLYKWQCPNLDFETFLEFIAAFPKENLYLYGAHCCLFPEEVLEKSGAAGIIKGEPESMVLDLARKEKKYVPGLVYKQGGKIISNPKTELVDLNSLPLPAYHLVKQYKYNYEILGDRFMIFEGARGCPYKCTYCLQVMYGNTCRLKSSTKLIAEVETAISKFGIKNAYFYDETFTFNKKLVKELCNYLIKNKHGFRWTCQTRPDALSLEMLKMMKEAGCVLIHFGIESGSQRILERIEKQLTLEQIRNGIELTKSAGIQTACFFMFGFPEEIKEDFKKTIELAKQLNPTYASFHIATPYPGTKFYESIKGNRKTLDFPQSCPGGNYSLKELTTITRNAYYSFYLRPGYLAKRISGINIRTLPRELRLFIDFIK